MHLVFLWIADPAITVERVAIRISRGGHFIPEDIIRRRHIGGIRNFKEIYMNLVDKWEVYDNMLNPAKKIAEMTSGTISVYNQAQWKEMLSL